MKFLKTSPELAFLFVFSFFLARDRTDNYDAFLHVVLTHRVWSQRLHPERVTETRCVVDRLFEIFYGCSSFVLAFLEDSDLGVPSLEIDQPCFAANLWTRPQRLFLRRPEHAPSLEASAEIETDSVKVSTVRLRAASVAPPYSAHLHAMARSASSRDILALRR